jgi:hypothetical protein
MKKNEDVSFIRPKAETLLRLQVKVSAPCGFGSTTMQELNEGTYTYD